MRELTKMLPVLLFTMLMTACASQPFNHIERDARTHFETIDTHMVVQQDEIYADIVRSQTMTIMGGGLLWALVDSAVDNHRTKNSEAIITPLRNKLIDYDFAEILADKINSRLKNVKWLNANDLVLERSSDKDKRAMKYKGCDASAILFLDADYKLSAQFDAVITRVNLIMFANDKELLEYREKVDGNDNPVDRDDNIYRNIFQVVIPLGVEGKKEDNVNTLVKNDCSVLKTALEESAIKIAEKIYNDIELDETADKKG